MLVKAYAKINLRLEVEKKLDNNYHILHMVNAKVDLCDELDIVKSDQNVVTFSIDELNHMEKNMCLDILNELTEKYKIKNRYKIYIQKNIPQGAGLGGGSSDAAAIINFINDEECLNLSLLEKIKIGKKYGADIPYCLIDDIAYVEGIGEIITPFSASLKKDVVIVYPNIFCSTKKVFENLRNFSSKTQFNVLEDYINNDFSSLLYNDLESSAFDLIPELKKIKEELKVYGDVIMSGSGSTFLLFIKDKKFLKQINEKFSYYKIFDCKII